MSVTEQVSMEMQAAEQDLKIAEQGLERSTAAARARYENALHAWELACRRADLVNRKARRGSQH